VKISGKKTGFAQVFLALMPLIGSEQRPETSPHLGLILNPISVHQ
jgi:hypothetical protein